MSDSGSQGSSELDRLYALIQARRWEAAEASARSAMAQHPRYYYPIWGLSLALLNLGRLDEARESAEAACAMAPDVFWNPMQLSSVARKQGDHLVALEAAQRSIELAPTSAEPYRRLAWACGVRSVKGDPRSVLDASGALAAIEQAIQLVPHVSDDHLFRASILERVGRRSEAASEYRTALELDPNHHESVNNLALLHLPRRPIRAARLFRESARIDPSCPNPRRNLTSAIHAAVFLFTWVLVGVGMASVALRALLGPSAELAVLTAAVIAGCVGGVGLWRTLPPGPRIAICRHRWPAGLMFAGICVVVLGADVAIILAGPRTRECAVALLAITAAMFLVLPRSRWSQKIGKRFGTWLVPVRRPRSKRSRPPVDLVSQR